ncbi:hypothetical protein [Thiocystis violacea]|uniref:hypothetical protein n=1 Tax=Thiocystis violacea TaxID=13725 RepID=UPI0019075888|nr:hypothetical protein [Thiocystis violacea]MBK1718343.1 hypothetical protein [Thiocystis violacea]
MRNWLGALALLVSLDLMAAIPATPVMSVYEFNGPMEVPYYDADRFASSGTASRAGTLAQGTSLIPCLVIRDGVPLTDKSGTPYVGFEIVVDPRKATRASTEVFKRAVAERKGLKVRNHHCPANVRHVISVGDLYALEKAPSFDPPRSGGRRDTGGASELDRIVRAFHASSQCERVNERLTRRRPALEDAWSDFIAQRSDLGSATTLAKARHLDYAMRTALYEGHLGRGCNAYGACERNIIVLSIRNRALGQCQRGQGCSFPGDFKGVSSSVSQYNIWDEYLTQISGLTSCYLRPDLADHDYYSKIQAMHAQTVTDAERILFGDESDLRAVFPGSSLADLTSMRHYYHAPAMGKCFPNQDRVEYMTGAVARHGGDFALIANARIQVGAKSGDGYAFKDFQFEETPDRDIISISDKYPGFLVDARKVSLREPGSCPAYGIPSGCRSAGTGRYRKVPNWLSSGKPVEIHCRIADRGESCKGAGSSRSVSVGGVCDKEMRPVARVP